VCGVAIALIGVPACTPSPPADRVRASGHVEATEVRLSAEVGGRLLELGVAEGDRVNAGDIIARLDTRDAQLALARAQAERDQAEAQLRLLLAGAREEDIRQGEAQAASADADVRAADAELAAAQADVDRFEALLASNSGSRKQRDDAVLRRDVARARVEGARERASAAGQYLARLRAGSRREEIDAARARVAVTAAQVGTLEKAITDASIVSPLTGTVTERLAEIGEFLGPRIPVVIVTDLDRVWANVYVEEPIVPRLRLGQPAMVFTDAGGPGLPGTVSFISSRAEFTPRNVQTAEDRSKLVYRIKVSVNNPDGTLKTGMPVETEMLFAQP
jgi:HlyD family secretion protein